MENLVRSLLLAVQFFTRIPLPAPLARWAGFAPERMRAAIAHMPAIGWIAGSVSTVVFGGVVAAWGTAALWLASPTLLMLLAALLSTLAGVLLTGGMHEDGLADVADGLGGHVSAERALQIMKDSRVGNYAVLAMVLALLLKVCLLAVLGVFYMPGLMVAMLAAHVVSRFFPLVLINWLPHVALQGQSKTRQVAGVIGPIALWSAALWCLPLAAFYWLPHGVWLLFMVGVATVAAGLAALCMGWWFRQRLQGFTGDCLGATQQVCELVFYATALTVTLRATMVLA